MGHLEDGRDGAERWVIGRMGGRMWEVGLWEDGRDVAERWVLAGMEGMMLKSMSSERWKVVYMSG